MLLFIKLFSYNKDVASMVIKHYCKCNSYAIVSNLKILTFSKVMDGISWGTFELSYRERGLASGEESSR